MKLTSLYWLKIYRSKPKHFTPAILEPCSSDELVALSLLLGIPYSGSKSFKITRILDMCHLREELSTWGEYQDSDPLKSHEKAHSIAAAISVRYKRSQLVSLARRAKSFYSLPKLGIIIGLLQWRARCRSRGQKFNSELRQAPRAQRMFPFMKAPF